jgi:hypothetical protein
MTSIANATTEPDEQQTVEVTPEMIRAGVGALYAHDSRFESADDGVVRIYWEMVMAKRRRAKS